MNRTRSYQIESLSTGGKKRVMVGSDGTQKVVLQGTDGSVDTMLPDGTTIHLLKGPAPRFGMLAPLPSTETTTTPGGLSLTTTFSRNATLADPANIFSMSQETDTIGNNGQTYQRMFDNREFEPDRDGHRQHPDPQLRWFPRHRSELVRVRRWAGGHQIAVHQWITLLQGFYQFTSDIRALQPHDAFLRAAEA
jgi:hypothetical protein